MSSDFRGKQLHILSSSETFLLANVSSAGEAKPRPVDRVGLDDVISLASYELSR